MPPTTVTCTGMNAWRGLALLCITTIGLAACSASGPLMDTRHRTRVAFDYEAVHGSVLLPGNGRYVASPPGDSTSHDSGTIAGASYFTSPSSGTPDFSVGIQVQRRIQDGNVSLSVSDYVLERDALNALRWHDWGHSTFGRALNPTINVVNLGGRNWFQSGSPAAGAIYYDLVLDARYWVTVRAFFSTEPGKKMDELRAANAAALRDVAASLELLP